jgi:hypothetical protein
MYRSEGCHLLCGYTDDVALQHGIRQTGACLLQKPFSLTTLAQQVRQTLGEAKAVND